MSMALDGGMPRSRSTDPVTSVDAGREARLSESQQEVLEIFRIHGALADHQLVAVAQCVYATHSDQRIRSARAELAEQGVLVRVPAFRTTKSGRRAQVWTLADEQEK